MKWIRRNLLGFLDASIRPRRDAFHGDALRANAIVFAPHGDDETLGCGGTIARKRAAGANVRVVVMTDGGSSHTDRQREELVAQRKEETIRALAALNVPAEKVAFLDFPDGELSSHLADATARVREFVSQEAALQLFVPYRSDGHPDHVATYRSVRAALNGCAATVTVWEYPIWAYRHWPWVRLGRPRRGDLGQWGATAKFVLGFRFARMFSATSDVGGTLPAKRAALAHYESQLGESLPDGMWSLARLNDGDFLSRFLQPVEVFRKRVVRASKR